MRRTLAGLALAAACALATAGCSSSSSSSPAVTGTETLSASVTGAAAAASLNSSAQNAPLAFGKATLTGPVAATITPFTLTGNGSSGTVTWVSTAGPLTVYHQSAPGFSSNSNTPPPATWTLANGICHFVATFSKGSFHQVGGAFVTTAWSGNYVVTASGYSPLAKGKTTCSFPDTGAVLPVGAAISFSATGPMTKG
jgi:hypothetical protein